MEITLGSIVGILREKCGNDSFVAGFIKSVKAADVETACIDKCGNMRYSKKFIDKYAKTRDDIFCIVMHELMHPLFNHFLYKCDNITNVACDAIINSAINSLYFNWRSKCFFRKLYKNKGLEGILQDRKLVNGSAFEKIHENLYPGYRYSSSDSKISSGEMITTLRILSKLSKMPSILVGSHNMPDQDKKSGVGTGEEEVNFSEDTLDKLAREFRKQAGKSDSVNSAFMEVLKTHLSIRKDLLRRFSIKDTIDKFLDKGKQYRRISSPVPIYPSKKDLTLFGSGVQLLYYHNMLHKPGKGGGGKCCVYLDVSGSVEQYLPEILGIISNMRNDIDKIYAFSNKVYETDFDTLIKGNFETTWGTDFDCIINNVKENKYKKCVIITDGYADMEEENEKYLKAEDVKLLTIYFGDDNEDEKNFKERCCLGKLGEFVNLRKAIE